MNTQKGIRFAGACLAIAALSTALSACGDSSTSASQTQQSYSRTDLKPLAPGEFAAPYDKQFAIGTKCRLVAYSFNDESGHVRYEYVIYGPNQPDGTKYVISKDRGATEATLVEKMNTVPLACRD